MSEKININNLEFYYKYIRSLMFDNLILILVLYFVFVKFTFDKEDNKFNPWIILYVSLILVLYFVLKIIYRRFISIGAHIRANDCMDTTNQIIVNKLLKPIESRKELLDRPFRDFIINSSHNTYIPCFQNGDIASSEAIKRALVMGARVIELDVFARDNTGKTQEDYEPVVAHGMERGQNKDLFTTSYVTFEECIDTIATYGFLTSDPLILCIENNTNRLLPTQERMVEILKQKFGPRLLREEYKINQKENRRNFTKEPIRNFLNKVIILAGGGNQPILETLIDGEFNVENSLGNADHNSALNMNPNNEKILRIYPDGNISGNFSLNYDPEPYWKKGFQIVTLNFGTVDNNLLKNANRFRHYSYIPKEEVMNL